MKKNFLILTIILIIIGAVFISLNPYKETSGDINDKSVSPPSLEDKSESPSPKVYTIEMNEKGFSPADLTISKGDVVRFISSGTERWPASNIHPTHTIYPGSTIGKCGTEKESEIFDSCGSVREYKFTFDEAGSWGYHDHLSPGKGGIINVK